MTGKDDERGKLKGGGPGEGRGERGERRRKERGQGSREDERVEEGRRT